MSRLIGAFTIAISAGLLVVEAAAPPSQDHRRQTIVAFATLLIGSAACIRTGRPVRSWTRPTVRLGLLATGTLVGVAALSRLPPLAPALLSLAGGGLLLLTAIRARISGDDAHL